MLSSAVIIPEQQLSTDSPSPSLKRRQSSITSDNNKRPRLETQRTGDTENGDGSNHFQTRAKSPPRRKSSTAVGAAEEKKRGQRLFGALLGTLSQTSSRPAHKKRDEIEQRQRERIKRDNQEKEEERKRQKDELDRTRRIEQEAWNAQSIRVRHSNMRATAHFLRTKAEPRLYYKPWDLREEEEIQIKRQIREVEIEIRNELGESIDENVSTHDESAVSEKQPEKEDPNAEHQKDVEMDEPDTRITTDQVDEAQDTTQHERTETQTSEVEGHNADTAPRTNDIAKDDDHGGDELVEGHEDDVIY